MIRRRVTHCPKGHEYTKENTYINPGNSGRTCRICNRKRAKQYYYANREKRKAAHREWAKNNRKYYAKRTKKYRKEHPEKCRAAVAHWKRNNPERVNANCAKRRALKLDQISSFTPHEEYKIKRLYEFSQLLGPEWHVDHIIPLDKDGLHHPDNLQIILAEDNLKKNNRLDYKPALFIRIQAAQDTPIGDS